MASGVAWTVLVSKPGVALASTLAWRVNLSCPPGSPAAAAGGKARLARLRAPAPLLGTGQLAPLAAVQAQAFSVIPAGGVSVSCDTVACCEPWLVSTMS